MTLTIDIHCDNAAFEDDAGAELARILQRSAAQLELLENHATDCEQVWKLRDINGNTVGEMRIA